METLDLNNKRKREKLTASEWNSLIDAINLLILRYNLGATIPTKLSQLINDAGFITDISGKADKSELFSGDYNDLTNKPTIPTVDLTKSQADNLYQPKGTYLTEHQSLNNYYTKQDTYSKTEVDSLVANSSGSDSSSGGFTVITNPSDSTKKGLVNSLSEYYDTNIGKGAVIEGEGNANYKIYARGNYSHAEGGSTTASGNYSHAEGYETIAKNEEEHASGEYNISNKASTTFGDSGNTLFSVGNGTSGKRHNAFEIRQNGDIYIADTSFLKEGNANYNSSFTYNNVSNICLQDKLDAMLTSSNVSSVAISGSYNDLNNRPFGDFIEQIGETIYTFEGTTTQNGPSHYGVSSISIDTSNLSAGDEIKLILDDNVYGTGIVYTYSQGGFWINQDPTNGTPFNDTWSVYTTNGSAYSISISNLGSAQHKIELVKDGGEQLVTRQIDSKYVDAYTKSEIDTKIADIASTYATKSEVPQIWSGTQAQYDAITTPDPNTIYIITAASS